MKKKYLSVGIGIILLVLGVTAVAAVRNTFQRTFPKQAQQPTTSPMPQTQISRGKLPQSCYENPESEECKSGLQEILDKECGGDPEAAACEPYFQEAVALQAAQECQKDPNSLMCRCLKEKDPSECLGQEIRGEVFAPIFCELVQIPFMGDAFRELCSEFSFPSAGLPSAPEGQTDCQLNPYAPECEEYAETVCLDDPYAVACEDYCLQNPESQSCQLRCQLDINLPGCQEFLQNYCQFYPYQPGCDQYFELVCAQDPYQTGCIEHCYQNPYTEGCLLFLAQYCRGNLADPLCMQVLCDRAPQLCTLCQQFPNLCAQIRW